MEPKDERLSADAERKISEITGDREDASTVFVPPVPELPQPPVVNYTRPALKRGEYASPPDQHLGVTEHEGKINTAARLGSGLSAGITFASSVVVSALIGMWIDRRFEPHSHVPWATIVMLFLGFAAGMISFVRISTNADEIIKRRK